VSEGASLRRLRRPRRALVTVALLVVVVLLVAVATFLGLRVRHDQHAAAARAQALHAARQESVNLVTLDYQHLDADIGNVLSGATGDFHDQYAKGVGQVRRVVTANQVRSTGTVLEAGIVSSDPDSATVLVVVDNLVRNKADQKGQQRHYRMQLQMAREHGRWRASGLEFVS
jgi:Mce-associated membrane protein